MNENYFQMILLDKKYLYDIWVIDVHIYVHLVFF